MRITLALLATLLLAPSLLLAGTTESNRGKALMNAGALAGSMVPAYSYGNTIFVGTFLDPSFYAAVEIGQGNVSESYLSGDTRNDANMTYLQLGGFARWYFGNSWNIKVGGSLRDWQGSSNVFNITNSVNATGTLRALALVGNLSIGNEWLLDSGILLGIDWLTLQKDVYRYKLATITANNGTPDIVTNQSAFHTYNIFLNDRSSASGSTSIYIGYYF